MISEASIIKKRQFAEERAERLKDPRARAIGIDKAGLDEQLAEKQGIKQLNSDRDRFFDDQRLQMDRHALVLQRQLDQTRRKQAGEVDHYRHTYQKKHMGREWDLNDPRYVLGSMPARVGDHDPRLGPSSIQMLEGEDLDGAARRRLQQQQQREWAQAQMDEKLMKKWMDKDAERQYQDRAEEMAHRTFEIERSIADQRRQVAQTTADFNRALAEQQRQDSIRSRNDNTQRNLEEIENMLNSDLLMERKADHEAGRADRKGMTADERRAVFDEQTAQREQMRMSRLQEAESTRQQEMLESMQHRMATQLDRQRDRERREKQRDVASSNAAMSVQAAERKRATDQLYANDVGEEYFAPFGKCL